MNNITRKRFIAGAVCPSCKGMDKIFTYLQDDKEYRECVSCGYKDEMRFPQQGKELETRVNQPMVTPENDAEPVQVLNFTPDKKDES